MIGMIQLKQKKKNPVPCNNHLEIFLIQKRHEFFISFCTRPFLGTNLKNN